MNRLAFIGCIALLPFVLGCFTTVNLIPPGAQPYHEKKLSGSGKNKVLLIDLSGVITSQEQSGALSLRTHPSPVANIKESLDKASLDSNVKAIILRINSPGGTVTASDLIYNELIHFKERTGIKIIATIMDLGASGGYYAAVAADKIIAHPTSVTGSIGVIMVNMNMQGLLEKIGVRGIVIKSGAKKDMGSPFREMTEEEEALFQGVIDDLYSRFVSVVAAGRKDLSEEEVRKIADGRIYTAGQALELGLIDEIGYLEDAITLAKKESGLKEAQVVTYYRPGSYRTNIYSQGIHPVPQTINLLNLDLRSFLSVGSPQFMYLWAP